MSFDLETKQRAADYAELNRLRLTAEMGSGNDGVVYSTSRPSAVKALKYEHLYQREKSVYARLDQLNIDRVEGFAVPRMIHFNDRLWVVEMEIVTPPFVLDFAGAYLDTLPPYFADEEVMGEWLAEKEEVFGDRWEIVTGLLATFRRYGIYLADVKYQNIEF